MLRQYVPKATDLSRWSAEDLEVVALALNNRPRKSLDWKTPAKVFDEQIRSLTQPVLHRPVELDRFTSIRYGERLAKIGATPSIGIVGDSYDHALAEIADGY